jgi:Family of unknown function (DUF6428)
MLTDANPRLPSPHPAAILPAAEFTTGALMHALAPYADKPLVFEYAGRDIQRGYHVTEVKAGTFASLDCGANPESWRETVIQLWDIAGEPARTHMPAGKFLAILRKVSEKVPLDGQAKLTFEVSDGGSAMQLFAASAVALDRDVVRVSLTQRPATCKPRDRFWLEQPDRASAGSCGSQQGKDGITVKACGCG